MLTPTKTFEEIRSAYKIDQQGFKGLIIGEKGAGKTTLLETARKPILLDCFDPNGEVVLMPKVDGILKCPDWLVPRTEFQRGDAGSFQLWMNAFDRANKESWFNNVGTYCLDSLTTWGEALLQKILKEVVGMPQGKAGVHGAHMEIQDWGTFLDRVTFYIKAMLHLPCDVILLGHIQQDQDAVTGQILRNLMLPGQSSQRAPIWISEIYYLLTNRKVGVDQKTGKPFPVERYLLTSEEGPYKACTRLKGLELHEEPNIKKILAKAGLPCEDVTPVESA